jgi:hypothetical protein
MKKHLTFPKFAGSICLNDLFCFLENISWNNIKRDDMLYYSSHSKTDFVNLKVKSIDKEQVFLDVIYPDNEI